MFVKSTRECAAFTASDGCTLREVLHPKQDPLSLPYSLAHAAVAVGGRTFRHCLRAQEVYYLLAGQGRMHIDDDARVVNPGDAVVIPAGALQWIENTGTHTLEFLALVDPPWRAAHDRLVPDLAERPGERT